MKKSKLAAIAICAAMSWPIVVNAQHVVPMSSREAGLKGEIKIGASPVGSGRYTGKETKGVAGAVNRARDAHNKEQADKQREAIKSQQKQSGGNNQQASGGK